MNQNLLRLIYSHKKCNLTDQQILTVLLGMGIVETVAIEHLNYYNQMEKDYAKKKTEVTPEVPELAVDRNMEVSEPVKNSTDKKRTDTVKNIKENNMKNFTALKLYENIIQANESLKEYSKVNANASYSAMTVSSILEQAINSFPVEINIIAGRSKAQGGDADESKLNPGLKYEIAESLYGMLNREWLEPVKNLCGYIAESMKEDKWGYVAARAMKACGGKTSNNMYAALYEQLYNVLESDNIYESLRKLAVEQEFWSNECKQVLRLIEKEEYESTKKMNKTVVENNNCSMVNLFSPVITNGNQVTFNLWGKNYTLQDGKIMEAKVNDDRYNNVVNGLSRLSYNAKDNTLEYYGANGKVLEYDLTTEKIHIGNNDLTNLSSLDIRDSLSVSGLFTRSTVQDIDTLVKFFESRDMLANLDNFINLRSNDVAGLYLTLIAVEEGVYVNKVDFRNKLNEMKYFASATAARKYIKENINYDASVVLQEQLKAEGDRQAQLNEKRNEIQDRIDFLKEKRAMVVNKIETLPSNIDNKDLMDALNLLECEIRSNEEELATTFTNNLGDDYVPVKMANVNGTLQVGDVVYVRATEFTSCPECTTISVIDPKTNTQVVVNKTDLVFDINHDKQPVQVDGQTCPTCGKPTCTCGMPVAVNDCNEGLSPQAANSIDLYAGNDPSKIEMLLNIQRSSVVDELKQHFGVSTEHELAVKLSELPMHPDPLRAARH